MRYLKTFAAVVLVCFSFAFSCFGQKIDLRNTELYVNDTLYAYLEECPPPNIGYNYSPVVNRHIKKYPSYRMLSPDKTLLAYILPKPNLVSHSERKSPHPYFILFSPKNTHRERLNYEPVESIKQVFIEDLVKFELISNNKLNRPALKKLFEHYNKDILKSLDDLYRPYHYYPAKEIDCKEGIVKLEDSFIYKYRIVSMKNDSIVNEVAIFDEFNEPSGRATFISLDFQNGERLFKYKFTSSQAKEFFLFIPEFNGILQLKRINCYNDDNPKMQLILLLDYLKYNYYL